MQFSEHMLKYPADAGYTAREWDCMAARELAEARECQRQAESHKRAAQHFSEQARRLRAEKERLRPQRS